MLLPEALTENDTGAPAHTLALLGPELISVGEVATMVSVNPPLELRVWASKMVKGRV